MRNVYFLLVLISLCTACGSNEPTQPKGFAALDRIAADSTNYTQIQWIDSIANFGTINEGEVIEVIFKCKNIGNKPLYIIDVQPGCGCTTPSYSAEAIAPQKEGWVKGIFNSLHQQGEVHKSIRVITNTINSTEHKLSFTGTVIHKS
ncbi:MAG: DUF1573 domain-containing protein [Chitinophagaceae bacterium]|nr:DUF1573 domain-containing protein [Chitinophagaceae bacterium]MCW5905000.1 DUF1573 domain-containing protein [Chitinophagaceae bacterium]